MARQSAGILAFQRSNGHFRVLLVHPGGPFWQSRDLGAWSIPKGEFDVPEIPEDAARREFLEETGARAEAPLIPLGSQRQRSGKIITAFAMELDFDVSALRSCLFEMEWPPRSGRMQQFPEVDRAGWFDLAEAREKIVVGQRPFLDRLWQGIGRLIPVGKSVSRSG